jgi:hypothetical protein
MRSFVMFLNSSFKLLVPSIHKVCLLLFIVHLRVILVMESILYVDCCLGRDDVIFHVITYRYTRFVILYYILW